MNGMATIDQAAALLSRIGHTSRARVQRLLDNMPVLEQIMQGHVSPRELRELTEERYVPLSDYGLDPSCLNWRDLRTQLGVHGITWDQVGIKEEDGSFTPYRSVEPPESLEELFTFFKVLPPGWLIRLPAAY